MDTALTENSWVTEEELITLSDTDKKAKLMEALYLRLNPGIHSKPDLGKRPPASDQGGLCGLAALQHALGSTVATRVSQKTLFLNFASVVESLVRMGVQRPQKNFSVIDP